MQFRKIITAYSERHVEHLNTSVGKQMIWTLRQTYE